MPYNEELWQPATIPDNVDVPPASVVGRDPVLAALLRAILDLTARLNIRNSRSLKILNRFRVVMDTDKPTAGGTGFLWIDTTNGSVWYDDPGADPFAWVEIAPGSGAGTKLDTTDFDDKLSAADDDVQKALDTLDDHNHDADYLPATIGGVPTAGHLTKLATVAVPPPSWSLEDAGVAVADLAPVVHTHVEADITDLVHYDTAAIHDDESGEFSPLTEKEDLVNDDLLLIEDSEATYAKKKARFEKVWEMMPDRGGIDSSAIHDDEANEISALTEKNPPDNDDIFIIEDSGASYVKKKVKVSSLPSGSGGGLTQAQVLARGLGA